MIIIINMKYLIKGVTFTCIHVFEKPFENRKLIYKLLLNKSGIYCWVNKINGKAYVGSSINLGRRLKDYLRPASVILKQFIFIAIFKYGIDNFDFIILEDVTSDPSTLLVCEQYYLDLNLFEYNIACQAGNTLGVKYTDETRAKLSIAAKNNTRRPGYIVTVLDIETNITTSYKSIRKAALALDSDIKSIIRQESIIRPDRGRYTITIHRTNKPE